jgi:hypothetical protein
MDRSPDGTVPVVTGLPVDMVALEIITAVLMVDMDSSSIISRLTVPHRPDGTTRSAISISETEWPVDTGHPGTGV